MEVEIVIAMADVLMLLAIRQKPKSHARLQDLKDHHHQEEK
jgi:hypothetical protein